MRAKRIMHHQVAETQRAPKKSTTIQKASMGNQ
jgi:hypothetical protein